MNALKKKLLFLFLIFSLPGFTQVDTLTMSNNNKFIISVSLGISFPLGEFSSYKPQNYYTYIFSGVPKTGFTGKLDACYLLSKKHFGAKISIMSSVNKSWSESEESPFRIPGTALGGGKVVTSYDFKTKNWYFNAILAGLFVEPIHSPKFSLRYWVAGGLLQSICPKTQLVQIGYFWDLGGTHEPFIENVTQPQMISYKFALNTGSDFSLNINSKFKTHLSIEFLASDAIFHGKLTDYYMGIDGFWYNKESIITITKRAYILYCTLGVNYIIN